VSARVLLPLLLLLAAPADAVEIRSYELRVDADAAGAARANAILALEGATPGLLVLPLGYKEVTGLRLTGAPEGTTLAAEARNGRAVARFVFPDEVPASVEVRFAFEVADVFKRAAARPGRPEESRPDGRKTIRHELLNTQELTIDSYRFELALPDGSRGHAVREALPKLRKGEPGPRARLEGLGGRPAVRLQVDHLAQGEVAAVEVELMPVSRSYTWMLAGVVLSLLYLVQFRDLVARRA
jgi:hypothetical protein